jgi:hypothetical protein
MKDFIRKGHERPSAYVREMLPAKGIKLYDHWIAPHDLKAFAEWILSAYDWCNEQAQGEEKIRDIPEPKGDKKHNDASKQRRGQKARP